MIKKDIVYREDDTQSKKIDSEQTQEVSSKESSDETIKTSVDKIFEAADSSMQAKRGKKFQKADVLSKKSRKKRPFRRVLLECCIGGSGV